MIDSILRKIQIKSYIAKGLTLGVKMSGI